jgi:LPXTG-motif cell wall-anchored protein
MKSLRTKIAAVAIAIVALVAAPTAAMAYTPVPPSGTTTTIPAGGSATFLFDFSGTGTVTYTLTGEGVGPGSLAMVKAAPPSTQVSKAVGETVTVTLPSNATETYTLVGTLGSESITLTINATLATTGFDASSMLGVWIGGGVLLLGGVLVTVFAARRERQDA